MLTNTPSGAPGATHEQFQETLAALRASYDAFIAEFHALGDERFDALRITPLVWGDITLSANHPTNLTPEIFLSSGKDILSLRRNTMNLNRRLKVVARDGFTLVDEIDMLNATTTSAGMSVPHYADDEGADERLQERNGLRSRLRRVLGMRMPAVEPATPRTDMIPFDVILPNLMRMESFLRTGTELLRIERELRADSEMDIVDIS